MPEIGATLRDARMDQRVELTEVEVATKIRAKYLRALENEEWEVLPGPTYVRTFLRTYAEFLGLDARTLVEEYKQDHGGPSPHEMRAFQSRLADRSGARRRARPRGALLSPRVLIGMFVVLLIAALVALGLFWPDDGGDPDTATATPTPTRVAAPATVQVTATGTVRLCLVAGTDPGDGRVLVRNRTLRPGQRTQTYRGAGFRIVLSNTRARLRVNGEDRELGGRDGGAVAYRIDSAGHRTALAAGDRPSCSP